MTAREARSWKRFRLVNGPFAQGRADWYVAQLCHAVLQAGGVKKSDDTDITMEECLPAFKMVLPRSPEEVRRENDLKLQNNLQAFLGTFR